MKQEIFRQNKPIQAFILFTILSFLPSAIGILLIPIYLNHLTTAQYGSLTILNLFGGLYSAISILQLNVAMGIYYFDYYHDAQKLQKYVTSIFSFSIFVAIITFLVFVGIGLFTFEFIFKSESISFYPYGLIVLGSAFLNQIPLVYLIVLKNEYKLFPFATYSFLLIVLNAALQYYFIVDQSMQILGALLGSLLSKVLIILPFLILIRHLFDLRPNKEMIKSSLKLSFPILLVILLSWAFSASDRFFLAQLLDLSQVGKYALLINIVLLSESIFNALSNAYKPKLLKYFRNLDYANLTATNNFVSWHIRIGLLVLSGVILIGSNLSLIIDNPRYLEIVPFFSLGALIMIPKLLLPISHLQLMYAKKSNIIAFNTFTSLVLLLVLLTIIVPHHKLQGALYAVGIANLLNFTMSYFVAQKKFYIAFKKRLNIFLITSSIVLVICMHILYSHSELSINMYGLLQFIGVFILMLVLSFTEIINLLIVKTKEATTK